VFDPTDKLMLVKICISPAERKLQGVRVAGGTKPKNAILEGTIPYRSGSGEICYRTQTHQPPQGSQGMNHFPGRHLQADYFRYQELFETQL